MAYNSSGNRIQRTTPIVLNLIIINVLVFALQNTITAFDIEKLGSLYYFKSSLFKPYQFVTYMFLHANFTHILFNMFGLWMFGTILERYWGGRKFLIFYFICGIGAAVFEQLLIPYDSLQIAKVTPEYLSGQYTLEAVINYYKETSGSLGASGAIMGVLAAFAYTFPNTELYIMFIPIPVKAKYVIPVFVLIDLFGGLYRIQGDNIGHFAHLGGALIGFLLVLYWNKTNRKTFY
jgi:membrane associated rhomboid family serine protease